MVRDWPSAWCVGFTKPRIRAVLVIHLERVTLPATWTLVRVTAAGERDARVIDMCKVVVVGRIEKILTDQKRGIRGTPATKPKNQMDRRPDLNIVVPEGSAVFELLSRED